MTQDNGLLRVTGLIGGQSIKTHFSPSTQEKIFLIKKIFTYIKNLDIRIGKLFGYKDF
jgi:hypothetical protein